MLTWGVLQGQLKQIYNTETNRNLSRSFENCKLPFSRRETDQRERALVNSVAAEGRVAAVYSEGYLIFPWLRFSSLARILALSSETLWPGTSVCSSMAAGHDVGCYPSVCSRKHRKKVLAVPFVFGNLFTLLRLTITFAQAVGCWG